MFNFIKNLNNPEKKFGTGGINDIKDDRDFVYEELGNLGKKTPVSWREKPQSEWKGFEIFNQSSSSSCVAQTVAKLLGVENNKEEEKFLRFSSRDIYERGREPGGGMYYREAMDIGYRYGAALDYLMPSENMTEDKMIKAEDRTTFTEQTALISKGGNYFSLSFNFDDIASILEQGKAVCLGTRFDSGDWSKTLVRLRNNGKYGHGVAVVDWTLYEGKKSLIFDNSWGTSWGTWGQGIVTEDQKPGIVAAWYYADLPNNWRDNLQTEKGKKPRYKFLNNLKVGMKDDEIKILQDCLRFSGDFPYEIPSTGYFGGITLEAVRSFQKKNGIDDTGYVGELTLKKLNDTFN